VNRRAASIKIPAIVDFPLPERPIKNIVSPVFIISWNKGVSPFPLISAHVVEQFLGEIYQSVSSAALSIGQYQVLVLERFLSLLLEAHLVQR